MKGEILKIIEKEFDLKSYKDEIINYASDLIDYYEDNRELTTQKFTLLLEKYNYDTIPVFSECVEYPGVALFHGSGNLEFWACIDYEGGVSENDEEIGQIIAEPSIWLKEEGFPHSVQNEISDLSYRLPHLIAFVWLCTIWQNIEGYKSGIVVKTLENNSVREFLFNDLAWDDLSDYKNFNSKDVRLKRCFSRDLTIYELYQRIKFNTYPFNPYDNKWRKFTKDNGTIEIVGWGNEVGERADNGELIITNKHNLLKRLKWEKLKSDQLINDDYYEVYYEDHEEQIRKEAIEFSFHSGTSWYYNEQKNRLQESDLISLESELRIQLPFYFRQYLKLLNGRKFNRHKMKFTIDKSNFIKIEEFYNIEELKLENQISISSDVSKKKEKIEWLKIARTESFVELKIGVMEHNNGALQLYFPTGEILYLDPTFENFIKAANY